MIRFTACIQKFDKQGEKSGWCFIAFTAKQAGLINPGVRTAYRVKGYLDDCAVEKLALLPMGNGRFILPLNAGIRKALRKQKGATVNVQLEHDAGPVVHDADFLECLNDEPAALQHFQQLPKGHQNYFSKWIESAKTGPTKAKRIAMAVTALAKGWGFPEMLRAAKAAKDKQ